MVKKGKSGKKKQNKEDKKDTLPEVDKEYYEIQIADLNKKIKRLRTHCIDLEGETEDYKNKYKALDEERSDIIAYLKRSLTQKQDEINDLTERLEALNEEIKKQQNDYEEKIEKMNKDFTLTKKSLIAEINLLKGKLNALEEFKILRETLEKRIVDLEEELKKETERHLEQESIIENQHLVQKENLRVEVGKRLLKLSMDLYDDVQNRIAETTHNVVRENIAVNNELNLIVISWQKLYDENDYLREKIKTLSYEIESSNEVKDDTLRKNVIQKQVIDRVVNQNEHMVHKLDLLRHAEVCNKVLKERLKVANNKKQEVITDYKKLENLHHLATINMGELKRSLVKLKHHNYMIEQRMKDAVKIIRDVIGLGERRQKDPFQLSEEDEYSARRTLLNTLLKMFDDYNLLITEDDVSFLHSSESSVMADDWKAKAVSLELLPCPSEPSSEKDKC